jgi:DNA ligase-1
MGQTIYKKDSSGKIRFLTITTEENFIVQRSGVIGTDNPLENKSACEPKNIGKSNETTGVEQAQKEAQSKILEKLRQGYFENQIAAEHLGGNSFLLPMLAKDFKKEEKKVTYPCYAQPKLDGMRSLGDKSSFMSRTGKNVDTVTHINFDYIDEILDGELYAHGKTFQEVMRMVKKKSEKTLDIKYHVYDVVMDLPFNERRNWIMINLQNIPGLEIVETFFIESKAELAHYHSLNLARGYEGTMVRHSEESYQVNKRSGQLLKYKDFLDDVYEIIDIVPSESRPEQGIVHCKGVDNTGQEITFGCGMKFSHEERSLMLKNKGEYIGEMAEIRFFEFSETGVPRFPVCYGVRLDK